VENDASARKEKKPFL